MNNAESQRQLTPCQADIEDVVAEFREAIDRADNLPANATEKERESSDMDIYISSCSADLAFYTWLVLNGVVDEPAAAELDSLFLRSLTVMKPSKFKDYIQHQYEEFKDECTKVPNACIIEDLLLDSSDP